MMSPSTRSLLALSRAGSMLVVAGLSGLTGCAGNAHDESVVDPIDETQPRDEHAPTSPLADDAPQTEALGEVQQPLLGSNTCRDVYIAVRNFWDDPITVRSIEYYNASEGRWQTEDLANRTLDANGGLEIWVEDLENAENDRFYSANLLFDHLDHTHNMHFNIPDKTCLAGHIMFDLFVE